MTNLTYPESVPGEVIPNPFSEADRLSVARQITDFKTGRGPAPSLSLLRAAVASIRSCRITFVAETTKSKKEPREPSTPKGKAAISQINFNEFD